MWFASTIPDSHNETVVELGESARSCGLAGLELTVQWQKHQENLCINQNQHSKSHSLTPCMHLCMSHVMDTCVLCTNHVMHMHVLCMFHVMDTCPLTSISVPCHGHTCPLTSMYAPYHIHICTLHVHVMPTISSDLNVCAMSCTHMSSACTMSCTHMSSACTMSHTHMFPECAMLCTHALLLHVCTISCIHTYVLCMDHVMYTSSLIPCISYTHMSSDALTHFFSIKNETKDSKLQENWKIF